MIDIHTHLLPGVDDGSRSVEQSIAVLERFAAQGVEVVVCTPHLEASNAADAPWERHCEILEDLVRQAPPAPQLRLGWEIMLDQPGVDLRGTSFGLGGSRAVLVEFPRTYLPPTSTDELSRLVRLGLLPVVAHPERYWGCTLQTIRAWRGVGACVQLDAAGMLGSEQMARLARDMLREGMVDCIASDNHGDGRTLAAARDWLVEIGASEQAELLTRTNPGRIIDGERPIPVGPVRIEKPLLRRLRELVLGRVSRG